MVFTAADLLGTDFEVFEFQVEGGPNVGGLTPLIFVELGSGFGGTNIAGVELGSGFGGTNIAGVELGSGFGGTNIAGVEVLSCTHDPLSTEDGVPFKQLPVFFPKLERLYQLLILIMLLF